MKKNLKRYFFKKWLFKKMLWVDVLFDQDSIFLIGSMSIVYWLCKRGGGSSNVHIVLKGGSSKCSCPFTRGRGGVKIVPNPVHVVCERPPWHIQFSNISISWDIIDRGAFTNYVNRIWHNFYTLPPPCERT